MYKKNKRPKPTIFQKKNREGAIEISFSWLFAIIAGIIIIGLAIYISIKIANTGQQSVSAQTGTEIGILLDPLETSFESSQTTSILIPAETRINNGCDDTGSFGRQAIQLDQKSFNKWSHTNINVSFENKYLFSTEKIEGKKFYVFSKPFNFPFKIADLFYMTPENDIYCFANAPDEIIAELEDLNQSNLRTSNCATGDIIVCFNSNNCNINVHVGSSNYVEKGSERMYFSGVGEDYGSALMYAAIFSNSSIYECQLKRLMMREKQISLIYMDNELITENKGCDTNLGTYLNELSTSASNFQNSVDLATMKAQVDNIEEKNTARECMLW
jgi:hypothetical protein